MGYKSIIKIKIKQSSLHKKQKIKTSGYIVQYKPWKKVKTPNQ